MFARPPTAAAFAAPPPRTGLAVGAWLGRLADPRIGASLAAGAVAIAVIIVASTGDPHAGAPSVRVRLAEAPRAPVQTLRDALTAPPPSPDALAAGQDAAAPGASLGGQAVITLPQGGKLSGDGPAAVLTDAPLRAGSPLAHAPLAGLSAPGPGGLLPIIGRDGRTPFGAYARPFTPNGRPKVALVVGGLGLNAATTKAAIERLPAEVTLSFVAYTDGLQGWIDQARANGHEVMLEIPMEPTDYPANDPGPHTLMALGAPIETTRRLEWLLSRATGYFAVTNYLGGRFLASGAAVDAFTTQLKSRGLGFLDDGSAKGRGAGPRASADAVVDQDLSSDAITRQLQGLEAQATAHGQSFGAGFAYPVTLEAVARWTQGLASRGYQLAPASAITRR